MAFPNILLEQHIENMAQRIYVEAIKGKKISDISNQEEAEMRKDPLYENIEKIVREEVTIEKYGADTKF